MVDSKSFWRLASNFCWLKLNILEIDPDTRAVIELTVGRADLNAADDLLARDLADPFPSSCALALGKFGLDSDISCPYDLF